MTEAEKRSFVEMLDAIQSTLEEEITNYSLESTEDLNDEENDWVSRALWFSRGVNEFFVVLTPYGEIRAAHKRIPRDLLIQITNNVNGFIYESLLDD
jgi:hypothetical protein